MFESLVYVHGGGGVEIRDIKMPDSSGRPPVHILSRPMLLYVKVFVRKFVLVYVCKSISVYALIIKLLLIIKLGGTIILLYILGILSLNKASRVKSLASSATSRIL